MTEYWPEGHEKSLNNDFNAVPKPKVKKNHRSSTPRQKHYKKKESKADKELRFDKAMVDLLAIKTGAFCPHIPTREENDRTNSIRNMG